MGQNLHTCIVAIALPGPDSEQLILGTPFLEQLILKQSIFGATHFQHSILGNLYSKQLVLCTSFWSGHLIFGPLFSYPHLTALRQLYLTTLTIN